MVIPVATPSSDASDDDDCLEQLRSLLLRLGRKRFGPEDEKTRLAMKAITDLDRLERLAEKLLEAFSWQDLMTNS